LAVYRRGIVLALHPQVPTGDVWRARITVMNDEVMKAIINELTTIELIRLRELINADFDRIRRAATVYDL